MWSLEDCLTDGDGTDVALETPVTNNQNTESNIPEERKVTIPLRVQKHETSFRVLVSVALVTTATS
jgi:hypothetical protein